MFFFNIHTKEKEKRGERTGKGKKQQGRETGGRKIANKKNYSKETYILKKRHNNELQCINFIWILI